MTKHAIFITIDALRFDVLSDIASSKFLFPAMTSLSEKGILKKVTTNAQTTQFVLPSLFSVTYPLDYGGYNNGIRDRPASYVECIQKSNIHTVLIATGNQMGVETGYQRGFNEVLITPDFRLLIEQKINRTLLYELQLMKKGKKNYEEVTLIIKKEFGLLLSTIIEMIQSSDQSLWPKKLKKMNKAIEQGSIKEKNILDKNPEIILNKMISISPATYWYTLGQDKNKSLIFLIYRVKVALNWRFTNLIKKQTIWPFFSLGHYQVLFGQILKPLLKKISAIKNERFFLHFHLMDVHDCRAVNHIFHVIYRLKFFPKWFYARLTGKTNRNFVYDSTAMYVDKCLSKLLNHLKKENIYNDCLILLTADHGSYFANSPRKQNTLGYRTYYEDIDVPMVIANGSNRIVSGNLCDSMGVTATFLDEFNIAKDKSFKGKSIFDGGREIIISENCGRGNADLSRRDIYFTVTSDKFKMMAVLKNNSLLVEKLYNLIIDPKEEKNIINDKKHKSVLNYLRAYLIEERSEIFNMRGFKNEEQE